MHHHVNKVGKFTVEVDQLEEQLISFLQEEFWLTQSAEELLHSGFFKVAQVWHLSSFDRKPIADKRPWFAGE